MGARILVTGFGGGLVPIALAATISCLPDVSFECDRDSDCSRFGDGRCDAGGCVYPDDTCPSGERYSRYADPSVSNTCVEAGTSSGGGESDSSGSP